MASDQKLGLLQPMLCWLFQRYQHDFKPAAAHAQFLHGLRNGVGQEGCGLAAQGGNLPCLLQISRFGVGFIFFQLHQVRRFIKLMQFQLPGRQQFRQFGRFTFVAACQADPLGQTFIQFGQPLRLQFGVPCIAAQRMHGVFHLRQCSIQKLCQRFEFGLYVLLIL